MSYNSYLIFAFQWNLSQAIANFDEVRFASVHKLVMLLMDEGDKNAISLASSSLNSDSCPPALATAKTALARALELSPQSPDWHCRLSLQMAVSDPQDVVTWY